MEIGRIQQSSPAATFKAKLELWNAERDLPPMDKYKKSRLDKMVSDVGNPDNKFVVTILPYKHGYGVTIDKGIKRCQQSDAIISIFSDIEPDFFEQTTVRTYDDIKYIPNAMKEFNERVYSVVEDMLRRITRNMRYFNR